MSTASSSSRSWGGIDTELKPALRALRKDFDAKASAIVSRDGLIIAGDVPEGISGETFGIMCATLLGAASTAHSELRIDTPTRVVVESEDSVMVVMGAGRKALLVTVVPGDVDRESLEKRLAGLVDTIKLI